MNAVHLALDHIWQSSLIVAVLAMTAALWRRKRAGTRYALWFAASLKFVVPFALLSSIGAAIGARVSVHVPQPAPDLLLSVVTTSIVTNSAATSSAAVSAAPALITMPRVLLALWLAGTLVALLAFTRQWLRARRLAAASVPLGDGREVDLLRRLEAAMGTARPLSIRLSSAAVEPGVFGIITPVLLWPASMSAHLSDAQIETILLHELSHVRRRDNLTALLHAIVQSLFWFHPMVWWIGARLVDERERACDEQVVCLGRDRQVYAESLLKTCRFCLEAPVTCMSGVTGSDLKRRVTNIMSAPIGGALGRNARVAIALAVVATFVVPIVGGAAQVPQSAPGALVLPDQAKRFDAASVRQNKTGERGASAQTGKGVVTERNMTLREMLVQAFSIQPDQLIGGPDWLANDRFDLLAKTDLSTPDPEVLVMLQSLLIDRFGMKVHVETRSLPIYAMVLARSDGTLGPSLKTAECETYTTGPGCGPTGATGNAMFREQEDVVGGPGRSGPPPSGAGGGRVTGPPAGGGGGLMRITEDTGSGGAGSRGAGMVSRGITMPGFAGMISRTVGRMVFDRTGLQGRYDLSLRFRFPGQTASDADAPPEIFTALQEQLGLKLEATRGPVDVLVIESATRPVNDDFVMPDQQHAPPPPVRTP
jgi:uncharacterized protein (TIGR03435 family)